MTREAITSFLGMLAMACRRSKPAAASVPPMETQIMPAETSVTPTETSQGYCHVCGSRTTFKSYEPIDFPCKRNSFICDECGSSARNRHVAKTVLERFPGHGESMCDFATRFDGTAFLTCTTGAIAEALAPLPGLVRSEYIDGVPSGGYRDSVLSQDIQATSFDDETFDLVITEDVLEHVPRPDQAGTGICDLQQLGFCIAEARSH